MRSPKSGCSFCLLSHPEAGRPSALWLWCEAGVSVLGHPCAWKRISNLWELLRCRSCAFDTAHSQCIRVYASVKCHAGMRVCMKCAVAVHVASKCAHVFVPPCTRMDVSFQQDIPMDTPERDFRLADKAALLTL